LTAPELKALAAFLKGAALAGGRDGGRPGRIVTGKTAEVPCPCLEAGADGGLDGALRFWGPVLNLPVPAWGDISAVESAGPPVYSPFPAAVLCAALVPDGVPPGVSLLVMPALSFRAAAVANMAVVPLAAGAAGYSFRWRIGPLFWLPKIWPDVGS
jgi:hypothetical protein